MKTLATFTLTIAILISGYITQANALSVDEKGLHAVAHRIA